MTKEIIRFCPQCGSPAVHSEMHHLHVVIPEDNPDDIFKCHGCNWVGQRDDLVAAEFEHDFAGPDDIMLTMMMDLRSLLAKTFAASFGQFLLKWGFISHPVDSKQLGRYTAAVARAVLTSVLQVRTNIEKEMRRGN